MLLKWALLLQPHQNPALNHCWAAKWCKHQISSANDSYQGFNLIQCLLQILDNNQSHPAWCKNPPGINLTTGMLPLITMLMMTAQGCSHFCPTNSKDIKWLQSPESSWEHGLYRMKSWLSPACWEPLPGMLCLCSSFSEVFIWILTSLRTLLQHLEQQHHSCFKERDGRSQLWDFSAAEISYLKK